MPLVIAVYKFIPLEFSVEYILVGAFCVYVYVCVCVRVRACVSSQVVSLVHRLTVISHLLYKNNNPQTKAFQMCFSFIACA